MAQTRTVGTDNSPSLTGQKRKRNKEVCDNNSRVAFTLLDTTLLFEKQKIHDLQRTFQLLDHHLSNRNINGKW